MVKKLTNYTNIIETENKTITDQDDDKCITTQKRINLTAEKLTARLARLDLASKNYIANFGKKTDLNKNELNELSKKNKAISTKGLTKHLITKFSIFNGAIYFSS